VADYKASAERWFGEVLSKGKVDVIDELVSSDFVDHDPFPGTSPDIQGLKDSVDIIRSAFPDAEVSADDVIVEGNRLAVRSTLRGTHDGDFMGIPATGKKVEVAGYDMVRFDGDKAAEHWGVIDIAAMMEQLGVAPGS
jgi:steroid delta-isomerase-like uncharacterized protein